MTATLNIRLSGGKHLFEGRVEQYYAGTWGTVCDDGWDLNDAKVVCEQLGLGEAVRAVGCAFFGKGIGDTLLTNVDCIGHESALGWCLHSGWRRGYCSHYKDAGVICKGRIHAYNILNLSTYHYYYDAFIHYESTYKVYVHKLKTAIVVPYE